MKKVILLFLVLFSYNLSAKPLSFYLKKHDLPSDVNILAFYKNDCVNCYFGFSAFIKQYSEQLNSKNFAFLFENISNEEIDNFFQYKLGLNRQDYKVIADEEFYTKINSGSGSSLIVIEKSEITDRYTAKNISSLKRLAKGPVHIERIDSIPLHKIYGTKHLGFAMINTREAVVLNKLKNEISIFDISTRSIGKTISIDYFLERYDSLLKLIIEDPATLKFNLEEHSTSAVYKSFPKLRFSVSPRTVDNFIYVGLNISTMEDKESIMLITIPAIVRFSPDLTVDTILESPARVKGAPHALITSLEYDFVNSDTIAYSISTIRKDSAKYVPASDSVCALYSISSGEMKRLPLSYEPFFPAKGATGNPMYYTRYVWEENKTIYAAFTRYPCVYDLTNNKRMPLAGIKYNTKDVAKGKWENNYFVIQKIIPFQDENLMIGSLEKGSTYFCFHNKDYSKLSKKIKVYDGYFSEVNMIGNTIYALEDYSEKKELSDIAVLHIYKIAN